MTKYNRQLLKKPASKPSNWKSFAKQNWITLILASSLVMLLSGCETLKLCQGTAPCQWQGIAPVQCPEPQKIPPELLTPLRLQPELDRLLSTP